MDYIRERRSEVLLRNWSVRFTFEMQRQLAERVDDTTTSPSSLCWTKGIKYRISLPHFVFIQVFALIRSRREPQMLSIEYMNGKVHTYYSSDRLVPPYFALLICFV